MGIWQWGQRFIGTETGTVCGAGQAILGLAIGGQLPTSRRALVNGPGKNAIPQGT